MKSRQDRLQASREAKSRKPNASVILIHLLLIYNENHQQAVLFDTSFLQVSETRYIRTKSTSDTVSCHSSYCETDKYPSSFTGPHNSHFPFFVRFFIFHNRNL